jgi:hypothetical protein
MRTTVPVLTGVTGVHHTALPVLSDKVARRVAKMNRAKRNERNRESSAGEETLPQNVFTNDRF